MVVTVRIVTEPAPGKDRRLLVAARELRVQIAEIAAGRGHAVERDADLLQRVGECGHVGQQNEHALLLLDRELLGHGERHVGHKQALERGVRGAVDEHHRAREHARILEQRAEGPVIVEGQAEPAEHNDIGVGLHADPAQQGVVRLAGGREDRDLLALDEAVEDVDHRHVGADHPRRHRPARRIGRGPVDLDLRFVVESGPPVGDRAVTGEDPAENVARERDSRRMPEETRATARGQALRAGEHLQRRLARIEPHDLRQSRRLVALGDQREIAEARAFGVVLDAQRQGQPDHVADDREHPVIDDRNR
jgi:hypothetical protein